MAAPIVIILPHSPEEFKTPELLTEWIGTDLKSDGRYAIATIHPMYKSLCAGSICLFMKNRKIVGEGILKNSVKSYTGTEKSPVTGKLYEGLLVFEPSSLRRYSHYLELDTIYKLTDKKINFRSGGILSWEDYGICLSEAIKGKFY